MLKITNRILGIGIPLSFPFVPSAFFDSFTMMEKPKEYIFIREGNGPIEEMRNNIVKRAKMSGCTDLIMMDTDMCFPPKTITKLLEHNLDIVGALCYTRYPPFDPLLFVGTVGGYLVKQDWEQGELVEVDATGTGCLMFKMKIFDQLSFPWFYFRPSESGEGIVGEDVGFCSDLKKAGYKIYVDTEVAVDHLTTLAVNGATHKLYKTVKEIRTKNNLGGK